MREQFITDTTNFNAIDYGDTIRLGEQTFTVKGHAREGRCGMEDPKFWVKKAVDMDTGDKKILKLSFFESFDTSLGGTKIRRFRNPCKEGEILELVRDHPLFMQGRTCKDVKGNNIRIIDAIRGQSFVTYIDSFTMNHETYFYTVLPHILKKLLKAFEAIQFLHCNGLRHGDIRNDHIMVEHGTENFIWIDFDYDYDAGENPFGLDLFGLGNILIFAVGKGLHNIHCIKQDHGTYGDLIRHVDPGDFSILKKGRLVNLRKLYPYIPSLLNDILMHFSVDAEIYYEFAEELIDDLRCCLHAIFDN